MIVIPSLLVNLVLTLIWIVYRIISIKKNKNFNKIRELIINTFFIYFLAVIRITLFKGGQLNLTIDTYFNANLIPIKETIKMFEYNILGVGNAIYNVVGNIVLFIPFGFFIPLLFSKCNKIFKVISYGFIFSLIIESLQFFTNYNLTDVDDIILNTFGTFIGILIYRFIFKIIKNKKVLNIVNEITDKNEKNLIKLSIKPLGIMLIIVIIGSFSGLYFSTYSESLTDKELAKNVFRHNEGNIDSLIAKDLGDYKIFLKDSGDYLDVGSVRKVFSNRYNNEHTLGICKNINGRYKVEVISRFYGNNLGKKKQIIIIFGKNHKAKNLNLGFNEYNFTESLKENEVFMFAYEINGEKEYDNIYKDIMNLNEGIKPKYLNIEFFDENGTLCDNIKFDRYKTSN